MMKKSQFIFFSESLVISLGKHTVKPLALSSLNGNVPGYLSYSIHDYHMILSSFNWCQFLATGVNSQQMILTIRANVKGKKNVTKHLIYKIISSEKESSFDVITSIVSFLWAYTTVARDVTGERVRTAYDVTAACCHKRRTQRNVFCHTWY